jgi:hypothetical protein
MTALDKRGNVVGTISKISKKICCHLRISTTRSKGETVVYTVCTTEQVCLASLGFYEYWLPILSIHHKLPYFYIERTGLASYCKPLKK